MYRLRVIRPSPSVLGSSAQASDVLVHGAKIITNWQQNQRRKNAYAELFRQEIKRPEADLRSFVELGALSMSHPGLGRGLLDRLVGIARQTGIHLTELRQLGNIGFIRHSGVLRLDLDNLR
jgi:hypothetical protein